MGQPFSLSWTRNGCSCRRGTESPKARTAAHSTPYSTSTGATAYRSTRDAKGPKLLFTIWTHTICVPHKPRHFYRSARAWCLVTATAAAVAGWAAAATAAAERRRRRRRCGAGARARRGRKRQRWSGGGVGGEESNAPHKFKVEETASACGAAGHELGSGAEPGALGSADGLGLGEGLVACARLA